MFRNLLRPIFSTVTGLLAKSNEPQSRAVVRVDQTPVVESRVEEVRQMRPDVESVMATKRPRIRRTPEEIALGLTAEEAVSRRAKTATSTKRSDGEKAKRIRRTPEEIELGLSIEEASRRRGVLPVPAGTTGDLIETLSTKVQARARAARYRLNGGKAPITTEMMQAVDAWVATHGVTKCPPGIDSDGYDHLNKRETR